MNELILPTFLAVNFSFENQAPEHVDALPTISRTKRAFELGVVSCKEARLTKLAVDLPSLDMSIQLILAWAKHQEANIKVHGYTDDAYLLHPSGEVKRVYEGWPSGLSYLNLANTWVGFTED